MTLNLHLIPMETLDSESLQNVFMTAVYNNRTNSNTYYTIIDNLPELLMKYIHNPLKPQEGTLAFQQVVYILHQLYPNTPVEWKKQFVDHLKQPYADVTTPSVFKDVLTTIGYALLNVYVAEAIKKLVPACPTPKLSIRNINEEVNAVYFAETLGVSIADNVAVKVKPHDTPFWYPDDSPILKQLGRQPEFRPVCDTDPEYDPEKHPYKIHFNGKTYDLTMFALWLDEAFGQSTKKKGIQFSTVSTRQMRQYNDELFLPEIKGWMPKRTLLKTKTAIGTPVDVNAKPDWNAPAWRMYDNMNRTNRYVDMKFLNDASGMRFSPLKQIFALRGYQIRESDRLSSGKDIIETLEDLIELFVYNFTDTYYMEPTINDITPYRNSQPTLYQGTFQTKQGLIDNYPDMVYEIDKDGNVIKDPNHIKKNRSFIQMTSASLAVNLIAPNEPVKDYKTVNYLFPAQTYIDRHPELKEQGIKQIDVLETVYDIIKKLYKEHQHVIDEFKPIYDYFKSFVGKNFNDSKQYVEDYGHDGYLPDELEPQNIYAIPKPDKLVMPYYFKDGTHSGSVAQFGVGGLHGQELNVWLYSASERQLSRLQAFVQQAKDEYGDAVALRQSAHKHPNPSPALEKNAKEWVTIGGKEYRYKEVISSPTIAKSTFKEVPEVNWYKANKAGVLEIMDKWKFTSVGYMNHEDFKSYYPNELRFMDAFYNFLTNQDRLGELYDVKETYGALIKQAQKDGDFTLADALGVKREGAKLGLNSSTGKSAVTNDPQKGIYQENNLRANNKIFAMRVIGQLNTFIIALFQAYEGARMPSTNTDGLFTILGKELNNFLLEEVKKHINIGIPIEPEREFVISKDTNNRVEFDCDDYEKARVLAVGGASTGAYFGVPLRNTIDHPAILDWFLVEYMKYKTMVERDWLMIQPFDREFATTLIQKAKDTFTHKGELLHRLQHIMSSKQNEKQNSFYYMMIDKDNKNPNNIINLQKQNRVYYVHDDYKGAHYLRQASLRKSDSKNATHDPLAVHVLRHHGVTEHDYNGKYATSPKIKGLDLNIKALICNEDLWHLSDEMEQHLIDSINWDVYLDMLDDTYTNSWMNVIPEEEIENAKTVVFDENYYQKQLAKASA